MVSNGPRAASWPLRGTVVALSLLAAGGVLAHDPAHEHAKEAMPAAKQGAAEVVLRDEELVDQDGRPVKFASEVLAGKLTAVSFFYTDCDTSCPVTSAIFARVQSLLGDRLGAQVRLVSLTVDPGTDTPPRIRKYAAKHGRKDGWTWLTGDKQRVDAVLRGLGSYSADITRHPLAVLVGDPASGRWSRLYGFPRPQDIVARLDALQAARDGESAAAPRAKGR